MLKLLSKTVVPLSKITESDAVVRRIADAADYTPALRAQEYFIVRNVNVIIPPGFAGYLFFEKPNGNVPINSFLIESALSYLGSGDIVKIYPELKMLRTLYRKCSTHNSLSVLATAERRRRFIYYRRCFTDDPVNVS
jgi:hypothetical protein